MSAADRRRAIIAAVIPLLLEKGSSLTTADMAQAAGVAEGTIFSVFPDKPALIYEAVKVTLEPAPVAAAIRAIRPALSMKKQLAEAARILLDHFNRVISLVDLLHSMPAPTDARKADGRRLSVESHAAISAVLTEMLERNRQQLRVTPAKAIAALRGLIIASGHPLMPPSERLTIDEVVAILLAGIERRD